MKLFGVAVLVSLVTVACAQDAGPPAGKGPSVSPPVEPGTATGDLRKLPKAKPYEPGDPVRVMPDLREDGPQPHVSPPVAPKTRDGDLGKAPTAPPADPNAPVRVRPDLKESPPGSTPGKSGADE